jgi:thymidylate synthase (FAD)
MRIMLKPRVYLICKPQIHEEGLKAFLEENDLAWPTPTEGVSHASRLVESAGRDCYMSYGAKAGSKTNQAYVNNLLGRDSEGNFRPGPAHGSVVEHPHWSFKVVGAGRGFSHELVRHRVGVAYSQLSTRYCDFEREDQEGTWDPGFCVPPLGQLSDETREHFEASFVRAIEDYKKGLELVERDLKDNAGFAANLSKVDPRDAKRMLRKAARGAARDVLPIGAEAIMTFTCNARSIWNMAYLRASEHAEGVIRDVFVQVVKIAEEQMPELFNSIVYEKVWDGSDSARMPRDKL